MPKRIRHAVRLAAAGLAALALIGAGLGAGVGIATAEEAASPVAKIDTLTGRSTSVRLDPGFVGALTSLGVRPSPSGKAGLAGGTVTFPITGGRLTIYRPGDVDPYVQGRIEHRGSGLTLTAGGTRVTLSDFVIDPGKPAVLTGKVTANGKPAGSLKLFDLDGSTLKPITIDKSAGTATLTGTTVRLSSEAARALNGAFKTKAIAGGTTIGVATIVVNTGGGAGASPN